MTTSQKSTTSINGILAIVFWVFAFLTFFIDRSEVLIIAAAFIISGTILFVNQDK